MNKLNAKDLIKCPKTSCLIQYWKDDYPSPVHEKHHEYYFSKKKHLVYSGQKEFCKNCRYGKLRTNEHTNIQRKSTFLG